MFMLISYKTYKEQCKEQCKKKLLELYGWTGSAALITAYGLTSIEYDKKIGIDILNLYGSLSIGIMCYRSKVWQAMTLEVAWFGIAVYSFIDNLISDE